MLLLYNSSGKYTALKLSDRQLIYIHYLHDCPRAVVKHEGRREKGRIARGRGEGLTEKGREKGKIWE